MRQDQYERLQALSEQLTDVFIEEADSNKWPGAGVAASAMDQQTRGDRYWQKKNAVATVALISRVGVLVDRIQLASAGAGGSEAVTDGEGDLDKDIKAAEKEAKKRVDEVIKKAKKTEFDKRVHGKT